MLLVIVAGRMLVHKDATGQEQFFFEDQLGYLVNIQKCIRWPGKYKVILLRALFHVFEDIAADDVQAVINTQFAGYLFNKVDGNKVALNKGKIGGATRCQLVTDAAGAAKQIERFEAFEIDHIAEHIK